MVIDRDTTLVSKGYIWEDRKIESFKAAFISDEVQAQISTFMNRDFNNDIMEGGVAIDSAVKDFNKILYTACSKSLRLSNKHRGQNGHKKNQPKHWFDQDLAVQRREMIRKSELYSKYPNDPIVKGNFFRFRKMYSKCCKRKYREFKASIIDKLDQLHDNDPNMYWSLLRKLKEDCNKSDPSEQITSGEWVNYFQNLFLHTRLQNLIGAA